MANQQIACPACRRVLNLPAEALNRVVQCPACKQSFHPAEATPASIRASLPKPEPAPASTSPDAGEGPPRPRAPLPPTPEFDSGYRPSRRKKKDTEDLCPRCSAFVPHGANQCPECKAEFEPEEFKPWEEAGLERRDSEPHRGTLLLFMGIGTILMPMPFCVPVLNVITGGLGIGVGIAAIVMASKDLRKMDSHEMDQAGRGTTSGSRICAIIGLALSIVEMIFAVPYTYMTLTN